MKYVNLGCGGRFHPEWTNFDIVSTGPGVIAHDLSKGIPLPNESCDVVYHAHVLEHLRQPDAERFMRECHRVLRPGGLLRVVVPDLERICRTYLSKMEKALSGDAAAANDYEWIMLELYDQTVREEGGGHMKEYLSRADLPNESFVYERIGEEGRALVKMLRSAGADAEPTPTLRMRFGRAWRSAAAAVRTKAVDLLSGNDAARARRIGAFRLAGEVHQWMYDRYSLGKLLERAGFENPVVQPASTSAIPDWERFQLDVSATGAVNKPDSLYMEARRPRVASRGGH
jgi:predicted SAM-dependent methyltransferase